MSKNPSVNPTINNETNIPGTTTSKTDVDLNTTGTDRTIGRFGQVKNTLTKGAGKVNQGVTTVGRSVSHVASDATKYTKDNPGKALAIAIGSGVGIGLLLGAATRRRRNNLFSIVSTAFIDAITDRIR
jgi:hypothetical protein